MVVDLSGVGSLAGGGELLGQHQAVLGLLDPLPAGLAVGGLDQEVDRAGVAQLGQARAGGEADLAVGVLQGFLEHAGGLGIGQGGQAVDDREPALAPGLGKRGQELVGRAVLDGDQGHGGRLDQRFVQQQLAQRRGGFAAPGPLELLAQEGLVVRGQIAIELAGQRLAELAPGALVLGDQDVVGHAVQGVVGLDVFLAAGLAEHLDQPLDQRPSALGDFGHRPFDLVLVDVLGEHPPAVRIGQLGDQGLEFFGYCHRLGPFRLVVSDYRRRGARMGW